jgi:hypothetical protein
MRKSPIEHLVHKHHRSGNLVHSYHRGSGKAPKQRVKVNRISLIRKASVPVEHWKIVVKYDKSLDTFSSHTPSWSTAANIGAEKANDTIKEIVVEEVSV